MSNSSPTPSPESSKSYPNCAICLEPIRGEQKFLSCCHQFHDRCIEHWLDYKETCPICRMPHNIPEFSAPRPPSERLRPRPTMVATPATINSVDNSVRAAWHLMIEEGAVHPHLGFINDAEIFGTLAVSRRSRRVAAQRRQSGAAREPTRRVRTQVLFRRLRRTRTTSRRNFNCSEQN
ncbi:uncharacterized protein LOC129755177 [Uranotaenia lowii]|uniref:uncharacterized protein LOC129755177 n=1 Tax=Uranotaenia lowii TaxID=190385 RepID=UPI0024786F13|nr:uncharacterized protein LOC129755177 [Uranotaenia lowii]